MEFKGKCKNVDRIVVSDPTYAENVWCRYERNDINGKNWRVQGFVKDYINYYDDFTVDGIEFIVALHSPDALGFVRLQENGSFASSSRVEVKEFTIGMDTACVGFGVNENADAIKASRDDWQPSCCLRTLTDGEFGGVFEGTYNNELKFIVLSGFLDEDTGYSKENILDYLVSAFNIELDKSLDIDGLINDANSRKGDSTNKYLSTDEKEL